MTCRKLIPALSGPLLALLFFISTLSTAEPLSQEEAAHLQQKGKVNVCIDPSWMPFEGIDKRGNYTGISADFMQAFSDQLKIPFELVSTKTWAESMQKAKQRECDILAMLHYNEQRAKFLNFTPPYISVPVVLIARDDAPFLDDFGAIKQQSLGIVRGYATEHFIRQRFPNVNIVYTNSLTDSLRKVSRGQLYATATTLPTALYLIQKLGLANLKVAGHTSFLYELSIGVRKDDLLLASALSKAVRQFPQEEADKIMQRWYTVKVQQQIDYTLLLTITAVFVVIIMLLIYRNRTVHAFNAKLAKMNARLTDRNQRLEQISKRDYLTGIYNRVRMDGDIQQEINRFQQGGGKFSVILFDLDNFQQVNLEHGHGVGDLILIEVCRMVEDVIHDWDCFGRWGGNSFIILCPDTSLEKSVVLADKLLRVMHLTEYSEGVSIRASFCCVEFCNSETQAELTRRMENALKQAKNEGGDRVITLQSPVTEDEDPE
ncbi:diguanylate cyclase [Marinobacterium jannaschii]|uniref:diguanylate cyclase n=1 Tax=Marinobacterium jannaschii TaxID=64970 RepID=UPI001B80AC03|nr:transporter substrate-binding domain-containing protein [Marinobacterium jannaschii]